MKHVCLCTIAVLIAGACLAKDDRQDRPDIHPRKDFRGHRGPVKHLAFSPDGKRLISAGTEGRIHLWDVAQDRLIRQIFPHGRTVDAQLASPATSRQIEWIAFSPDGKTIAEVSLEPSLDTVLRLWDPDSGVEIRRLALGRKGLRCGVFMPDGKRIAVNSQNSARWEQTILLCDVKSGEVSAELSNKRLAATHLAVSRDGKLLASAGARSINIWDLATRKMLRSIPAHKKAIRSIAFSPNGKLIVSTSADDTIRIWKVKNGKLDRKIEAEQDGVFDAAFSPDGRLVASAGANNTIKLWNPKTGKMYLRFWGHLDKVLCLAFSPDGKSLASGSRDTTIALWDVPEPPSEEDVEEDDEDWKD